MVVNEETLIEKEFKSSVKYQLSIKNGLVELTQDNVAKVEAMLLSNASYRKANNKEAKPSKSYKGSSAYWIDKFNKLNKQSSEIEYKTVVLNIVSAIDRENRTHLNADGVGINQITERICEISKSELIGFLKNPELHDYKLIKIISKETKPQDDQKYKSRKNFSFATKFCHFMAMHLFSGKPEGDNFPIYDSIVNNYINKYLKVPCGSYKKLTFNSNNYCNFIECIDKLRKDESNKNEISRNGFDHLIWFYYRS